jgi:hypothetical protein
MKKLIGVVLLAVALVGTTACGSHMPPNLTPQAQVAYTADQVVVQVGIVQQAAIDATLAKKVKDADGDTIVTWTRATIKGLGELPGGGWKAAALSAYPDVRAALLKYPQLAVYVSIMDGMLGYQGGDE